ncbi:hypothetical protein U14_05854 [Candidatus Moduliflexus flocculans]|uniref:Periplasmic heavy metal sensor n=1 Tax=Candidatus Moduliflexus flocculans TaxID=1499966 RepID=A0A081BT36_9BACT|nr:hypothetical protein U14_05854 [Candidatus Moduliflexus flocculans]
MRRMMFFGLRWVVILMSVGVLSIAEEPDSSQLQTGSSATPFADSMSIQDAVETLREQYLIKELQLSESRSQTIVEKMRYMRKLKKDYQLQLNHFENELAALFSLSDHDDAKIVEILRKLKDAKSQYYQELLRRDEEFQQLLTPEEQVKYVLFQRAFNQQLKNAIFAIRKQQSQEPHKPSQILRNQDSESVIRQPR